MIQRNILNGKFSVEMPPDAKKRKNVTQCLDLIEKFQDNVESAYNGFGFCIIAIFVTIVTYISMNVPQLSGIFYPILTLEILGVVFYVSTIQYIRNGEYGEVWIAPIKELCVSSPRCQQICLSVAETHPKLKLALNKNKGEFEQAQTTNS